MAKVWRKLGKRRESTFSHVSSYPKSIKLLYLWNASPLPPVMLIVFGITMLSRVHGTLGDANNDSNPVHYPEQEIISLSSASASYHHPHHHRHKNNLAEGDIEDVGKTVYECPDGNYPNELETFMQRLTTEMGVNAEEFDESLFSDGSSSTRRTVPLNDTGDCSSSKSSTGSGNLWSPNDHLFGRTEIRTQYRICPRRFTCSDDRIEEYHWHPILYDQKNFPNVSINSSDYQLSNMSLIKGGFLVWNKEEAERRVYRKEEFCISRRGEGGWLTFKTCSANNCSDPDLRPSCIRKCCPPTQVISEETRSCIQATPSWRPIFYRSASEQEENTEFVAPNASIIVGFPNCTDKYVIRKYVINESPVQNFKLLLNGTLVQIVGSKQTFINAGEFCIDGIFYGKIKTDLLEKGEPIKYPRSEWDQVVIACIPTANYKSEIDKWRIPLYASLNCVSALFLLATDIVYLLLWRHQNIHGWLQFAYATSLFCTFTCFVIVQSSSKELSAISESLCKFMGYMNHLTYLSAFFWLTSMNFDLWWRFSRPLRNSRMRPHVKKFKRFLGFAAFSIGIPLLISSIGITLDNFYGDMLLDPPFIIPGIGKEQCYFESKRSQIPYLYAPAGVLLLVDMIFFTSTVLHLRKIHAHTELARTQSTLEDKKGLRVIAKLFVVMGVLWIFELASWIAHVLFPEEVLLIYIFMPIDVLNCLQGVAIFVIFVCKPNVGNQLMALFRRDDAGKTWNKQAQHPSVATVQQTIKPNDYTEIK